MSKMINFRKTDADDKIIADLQQKLGLTVAAVIRQALRLLHKKECQK